MAAIAIIEPSQPNARLPRVESQAIVHLVPDLSEIDILLSGLPEQPFREGEARFDDLVTTETHVVSTLTGETIIRFKPTEKLISAVAALKARYGNSVIIHN